MVFLHFRLGTDRYVLDAAQVAAVIPLLAIKLIPQTPPAVVGAIDYRGTIVPVVDLSLLAMNKPASRHLTTRIVLVNYPDRHGGKRLLGLIAEHANETVRRDPTEFVHSGVDNRGAPYLGPVATDPQGILQWIQVVHLLTDVLRDALFPTEAA